MAVAAQIKLQLERMAKGRQTMKAAYATGDDFWTKVDAAADETYENRVKGSDMTAFDTALANMSVFNSSALAKWFTLHNNYFQSDLSLSAVYLESYLDTVGWRVPYEANECYFDAMGSRLATHHVFPKGTLVATTADPNSAGMHKFFALEDATNVETHPVVDGALTTCMGACMATADDASVTIAGTPKVTLTLSNASTVDITLSAGNISDLDTKWKQVIVGGQALTGVGAIAADHVDVGATAGFVAGCYALVTKDDCSMSDLVLVSAVSGGNLVTFATTPLRNAYDTDDFIWPLCTNAVWKAGTLAQDKEIDFWARPDMIIAL